MFNVGQFSVELPGQGEDQIEDRGDNRGILREGSLGINLNIIKRRTCLYTEIMGGEILHFFHRAKNQGPQRDQRARDLQNLNSQQDQRAWDVQNLNSQAKGNQPVNEISPMDSACQTCIQYGPSRNMYKRWMICFTYHKMGDVSVHCPAQWRKTEHRTQAAGEPSGSKNPYSLAINFPCNPRPSKAPSDSSPTLPGTELELTPTSSNRIVGVSYRAFTVAIPII
jgi:hypothetical protein